MSIFGKPRVSHLSPLPLLLLRLLPLLPRCPGGLVEPVLVVRVGVVARRRGGLSGGSTGKNMENINVNIRES